MLLVFRCTNASEIRFYPDCLVPVRFLESCLFSKKSLHVVFIIAVQQYICPDYPLSFANSCFHYFPMSAFTSLPVHQIFPECVARVPVSLCWPGGWGCVRSTLRLRPQPFATVHNRLQKFATVRNRPRHPRMAVPMVSSAKGVTFGGCACRVASFRVAGVSQAVGLVGTLHVFCWHPARPVGCWLCTEVVTERIRSDLKAIKAPTSTAAWQKEKGIIALM